AERPEDVRPLLAAGLEDTVVLPRSVDAPLGLCQRQGEWFLAVHVLARLHRLDRGNGVPVLGRGNAHGVDVRPTDQLTEVDVRCASLVLSFPAIRLLDSLLGMFATGAVDLADRQRLDVTKTEELRKM